MEGNSYVSGYKQGGEGLGGLGGWQGKGGMGNSLPASIRKSGLVHTTNAIC